MPTHPKLTRLLRDHLANFGPPGDGLPVRRGPGRRAADDHLPARLGQGPPGGAQPGRAGLAARAAPVRPAACLPVHAG